MTTKRTKKNIIRVYLDDSEREKIDKHSKILGVKPSQLLRMIIRKWLIKKEKGEII